MMIRTRLRGRPRGGSAAPVAPVAPVQGQNMIVSSQDFSDPAWNKTLLVVAGVNIGLAPDGTMTSDQLDFGATPSARIYQNVSCNAGEHVFSIYAKTLIGEQNFMLQATNSSTGALYSKPMTANSSWQRFQLSMDLASSGVLVVEIRNTPLYIAGSLQIWGSQLEVGASATAYVKT